MAPPPPTRTYDYYVLLGVERTADADALKAAWRKQARIKHPDKNPGNPNATVEFQQLESAYSTLCDPALRRAYDLKFPPTAARNGPTTETYHQTYTSTASNDWSDEKIREGEMKREDLFRERNRQESEVFEAKRELNRLVTEIERLDEDARTDVPEDPGWWGYFSTFIVPGSRKQREEKTLERTRRGLDRIVVKRIRERELERQTAKVASFVHGLQTTRGQINKITQEINKWREEQTAARRRKAQREQEQAAAQRREAQRQQEEHARRERARREEELPEAIRRATEWDEKREKARREENAAAEARLWSELLEAKWERDQKEAAEMVKRAREQAARASEQEARRKRERDAENAQLFEKLRRARKEREGNRGKEPTPSCAHKGWWKKIDGPHVCSNCSKKTNRFALECPRCKIVACASCRKVLETES